MNEQPTSGIEFDPAVTPSFDPGVPHVTPRAGLEQTIQNTPGMRSRWIYPPLKGGWDGFVLSEWELRSCGFTDHHPHVEVNVVLEGELHVECGGTTVVATAGDTVRVPAGATGSYWAPEYARMVAIYGSNPDGEQSTYLKYWDIAPPKSTQA